MVEVRGSETGPAHLLTPKDVALSLHSLAHALLEALPPHHLQSQLCRLACCMAETNAGQRAARSCLECK